MREAVSDVLSARREVADGLTRMVWLSLGAHLTLVAIIALLPGQWFKVSREEELPKMMISLGGSPGQNTGGMTQASARPIQQVAPPEPKQPFVQAPAATPPKMTIPEPSPKPAPKPNRVEKPAETSSTRKPTTGAEIRSGASRVETGGAPVPFGGLSTSGGGGFGATLDVSDFCCPAYVQTMVQLIRANWNEKQGVAGKVVVKFTIRRDGMLTNVEVAQASGNPLLDLESRRAVLMTQRLPPLPAEFTRPTLTVNLMFEYNR
jgi:periplasmic protein TonB